MTTQHKLSVTGKLAVVVGLAYAAPSFAANIEAIKGGAQVSQQKGVDIVNIVKPNEQGLSHNQYNKYNVSQSGAVLNNALEAGQSKLAGALNANSNFNGKAAEVILNEVVSKNPSLILGQQEVFGMAADYVLANPNGITYNGGNIINAPRASLVVGTPEVVNGKLDNFKTNNANALTIDGKVGGVSILDLVAPKVIANAKSNISAKQAINVVSGANKVGYTNGKIEKLERNDKAPVLDGQIFGSMNAGSIRIHATDDRATQTIKNAKINAKESLATDIAGNLNITTTNLLGGDITLSAKNTTIDGTATSSGNQVQTDSGKLERNVRFTKRASNETETFNGSNINATGALTLKNAGNLKLSGAQIAADSLNVDAKNVNADSVVTTNTSSETYRRTKGLWHNQSSTSSQDQTIHNNKINVKGDARINASNTLTLKGVNLAAGKDVVLAGAKSISLSGNTALDKSQENLDVRNETGKLKTGTADKFSATQEFAATDISVGGNLGLKTKGTLSTQGAKMTAAGDTVVDANKVSFDASTTQTSSTVDDQFKYWGGLGGGQENGKTYVQQDLQTSSLVTKGNLLIGAKNGVDIKGSTVKGGKDALVNAGNGKLNVTAAVTNISSSEKMRTGTIFNITKNKSSNSHDQEVVNGSTLKSDTNLKLVVQKDVNVLGSTLKAAEKLGITTAGNLNIATVKANSHKTSESFAIKGFTDGNAKASEKNGAVVAEATAGVGVRFTKTSNDTKAITNTGSNLEAGSIDLSTDKDANISGSNVTASGDVNVNAKNVNVTAAKDVTVSKDKSRVTEVGLKATAGVTGYNPAANVQLGLNSQYNENNTTTGTAQVSGITGGNVNLTAENEIKHEGSKVTATEGDINQNAKTIVNDVANNTSEVNKTQHAGGIFIGAGASQQKGVSVSAGIYGNGGKAQGTSNTAVASSLKASNDVNVNADKVTDTATNYTAGNNVTITADKYENVAAANNSNYSAKQGGASLTASASTKDMTNVNVNAGLKVNYDQMNTQASNATIGSINAGNVSVTAKDSIDLASNVNATNGVAITSTEGDVNFTQSNNTVSTTKTGVDVGLNVGAKVNVATGAVLPKGGVDVEVTHSNANASTGIAGTITTEKGNVNVTTNNASAININGASVISGGSVTLTSGEVNTHALTHTNQSLDVAAGGSFNLGTGLVTETTEHTATHMVKDNYCAPPREVTTTYTTEEEKLAIDSVGVGLHADVTKENGVSHTANQIIAKGKGTADSNVPPMPDDDAIAPIPRPTDNATGAGLIVNANNVNGKGITLTGTNVVASTAELNAAGGNVSLNSAEGSLKRTGGGAGFSIEGDVSQDGFKPTAGSAYVNVDLADNKTYTGSSVKVNNATVNSAGDLNLNSSTITAQTMKADVAGNVNITAEQNVVNETKVSLAAAGGKGIDPKSLTTTENVTTTKSYDVVTNTVNACGVCSTHVETVTVEETREETRVDAGKVANQVFSDLQNGTIMGVKAEAQIGVHVDKTKESQAAGIAANTLDVNAAGGKVNLQGATVQYEKGTGFGNSSVTQADNQDSSKKFDLGVDVSTNVPKMISYGVQHVTTGTSPLFNASAGNSRTVVMSGVAQAETPIAEVETN